MHRALYPTAWGQRSAMLYDVIFPAATRIKIMTRKDMSLRNLYPL